MDTTVKGENLQTSKKYKSARLLFEQGHVIYSYIITKIRLNKLKSKQEFFDILTFKVQKVLKFKLWLKNAKLI